VAAGPDAEVLGGQAGEEAAHGAALTLPEPEIEVILVRAGVTAEAGVAVDAQDRAQHPELGPDPRGELGQLPAGGDTNAGWPIRRRG
jgi:hypothetical protein